MFVTVVLWEELSMAFTSVTTSSGGQPSPSGSGSGVLGSQGVQLPSVQMCSD
jgi:hypothetical protein